MSSNKGIVNMTSRIEGKELIMERTFHAPRELVFKAFSDSKLLESWWGPEGWKTENKTFEFKQDGVWHYCMRCEDKNQGEFYGMESWGKAIYKEIAEPEKIVYVDAFSDKDGSISDQMPEMIITMHFDDSGEKTKLTVRSQFSSEDELKKVVEMGVEEGMASQFDCLDEVLAERK
ncbi:SRPBCC family protein [Peribacillus frigoritolerans]|uniref:SRPBCC family protein n=1 Tax=Peribacillus frigoritolerans TaxID=450367 RepID=UPI001059599E|nr:SRPBCC domain-containing protein [Peribacillus frigoritolerans]TDL83163.1 SRPBCC domain-containing protein [Peribacillus frigoritolerans]